MLVPRGFGTRTYLQVLTPAGLRPARAPAPSVRVEQRSDCPPALYRDLYAEVGHAYHWVDRLSWSDAEIAAHLQRPDITLYLLYEAEQVAGYVELRRAADGSVEIAYLGLRPSFIGRGLGGYLLTEAVRHAWLSRPTRVWLHTSTFDHPAALANYLARGFTAYKAEPHEIDV